MKDRPSAEELLGAVQRFLLEEATYLEGMLAALLSKSGKAGAVGGMEIPSVKSTILAFAAGARAVRPDFNVVTSYVGNWEDVGAAKEAALALVQQGADFLFHNADAAGLGVFQRKVPFVFLKAAI